MREGQGSHLLFITLPNSFDYFLTFTFIQLIYIQTRVLCTNLECKSQPGSLRPEAQNVMELGRNCLKLSTLHKVELENTCFVRKPLTLTELNH